MSGRAVTVAFVGAVALACLAAGWRLAYASGDAFWYIAVGRQLLDEGLVTHDTFAFTSTSRPFYNMFLGASVAWALAERAIGVGGIVALSALLGALFLVLTLLQGRASHAARVVVVPLLALLIVVDPELFEARAQNPGHLLFLALIAMLWRLRDGRHVPLYAPLLLGAAWVNWHPSFPLGVALPLFVVVVGLLEPAPERPQLRPLLSFTALFLLGLLATPYGPALLTTTLSHVGDDTTKSIDHMRSPPLDVRWLVWLVASSLVVVARTLCGPARGRRLDVALALLFVGVTLMSRRYVALSVVVSARVLLTAVESWPAVVARIERARVPLSLSLFAAAAVGAAASFALPKDNGVIAPVAATAFVEEHAPPERLFNRFAHGGYLMYRWGGKRKVFIDGRNDTFSNGVFWDYLVVEHAQPLADTILDIYAVNTVLWKPRTPLDEHLSRHAAWREVFRDDDGVVYVRKELVDTRVIAP